MTEPPNSSYIGRRGTNQQDADLKLARMRRSSMKTLARVAVLALAIKWLAGIKMVEAWK